MARSCGIRIGPRRYELVVLDGSAKKHKITAYRSAEFPLDPSDPEGSAAATLRAAVKEFSVPSENLAVAIDTGRAAFRRLQLPFSDITKVEQVLKFEIEGDLPQWNIDDVVVDFHTLASDENSIDLLVSAVPKDDIARVLDICQQAGIEPLEVELETSAIVNAAATAGICHLDDAQLLVHVGEYSTSVVVMDAGEVREMRVIHIGSMAGEPTPSRSAESEAEGDEASSESEGEPVPQISEADLAARSRRLEAAVKRIRRELGVTLSGTRTIHPIDAVYVCGAELPGLVGSSVLDIPIYLLDCFDEDGGQPADGFGELATAYGVAAHRLGAGIMEPRLRREELRFTGAFERIEFPLAVACLLLCTLMGVVFILEKRQNDALENVGILNWVKSSNNYMISNPKTGTQGMLTPAPDALKEYVKLFERIEEAGDPQRTHLEALRHIDSMVSSEVLSLRKGVGQESGIEQPQSAFVATTLVLDLLTAEAEKNGWRPSLRDIRARYLPGGNSGKPDKVDVTLEIVFFADNTLQATEHREEFERVLRQKPWFVELTNRSDQTLETGEGIYLEGYKITLDLKPFYEQEEQGA